MLPQVYAHFEPSAGVTDEDWNIATDPFMTAIFADPVLMGDLVYNYLTHEMQGNIAPYFSDWLGYPLPLGNAWSASSSPLEYVSEQSTPDFTMPSPSSFPSYFPLTPSSPPSQTSTPERQRLASPPHEPSCHRANPFFERIRGKWCCDACKKDFRGHWECKRHITNAGKRAKCLACNKKIAGRDDSLRRHYYKHCKRMDRARDYGKVRLEDAFVHV